MQKLYALAQAQVYTLQLAATAYAAKWLKNTSTVYREAGRFTHATEEAASKAVTSVPLPNKPTVAKPTKRLTTKSSVAGYSVNTRHILQGDVEVNQLRGGMHTKQAIDGFCSQYGYNYKVLRQNKNGVAEVELPQSALKPYLDGRIPENRKTLFPNKWSNDKIMDAIEDVVENNTIRGFGDRQFVEGVYEGVMLRVCLKHDKIVTAYPRI